MNGDSNQTILLDIYERLGSIETTLKSAALNHDKLEREVAELTALKQKFGGVILTLTVVWGLICGGAVYFSDAIKAKLHL